MSDETFSQESKALDRLEMQLSLLPIDQRTALRYFFQRIEAENAATRAQHEAPIVAVFLGSLIVLFEQRVARMDSIKATRTTANEQMQVIMKAAEAKLDTLSYPTRLLKDYLCQRYSLPHRLQDRFQRILLCVGAVIICATCFAIFSGLTANHHTEVCARVGRVPLSLVELSRHQGKAQAEQFFLEPSAPTSCR